MIKKSTKNVQQNLKKEFKENKREVQGKFKKWPVQNMIDKGYPPNWKKNFWNCALYEPELTHAAGFAESNLQ